MSGISAEVEQRAGSDDREQVTSPRHLGFLIAVCGKTPAQEDLKDFNPHSEIRNSQLFPLAQPCAAFFTDASGDVAAQIFSAGRASPVKAGKTDERRYDRNLRSKESVPGDFSEQVGAFIDHSGKYYEKQGRRNGDELAALARPEFLHDSVPVLFFHLHP